MSTGEEKTKVILRGLDDRRRKVLVNELRAMRNRVQDIEHELTIALGLDHLPGTAQRFDRCNAALTVMALNLEERTNEEVRDA